MNLQNLIISSLAHLAKILSGAIGNNKEQHVIFYIFGLVMLILNPIGTHWAGPTRILEDRIVLVQQETQQGRRWGQVLRMYNMNICIYIYIYQ